jgi:hypothetical protein
MQQDSFINPPFQWKDSHINAFAKKFKNTNEDITSEYLARNYIPGVGQKVLTAQDRRNLMKLIVVNGYARVIKGTPASRKYTIRMNSDEMEDLYFDSAVLSNPRIFDLPRVDCLGANPTVADLLVWLKHKMRWLEIYNLFCRYQNEGNIDLKYLQHNWSRDLRNKILLIAKEQITLYKVIKLGSQAMQDNCPEMSYNYQDLFLDMLVDQSEWLFRQAIISQANANEDISIPFSKLYELKRQVYGYATKGQDEEGNFTPEDASKANNKLLMLALENGIDPKLSSFASGIWLPTFLAQSNCPIVQKAIEEWFQVKYEYEDYEIKLLNRYKRTEKRQDRKKLYSSIQEYPAIFIVQRYLVFISQNRTFNKLGERVN